MFRAIVDTNVTIVANRLQTEVSLACQIECIERLEALAARGTVLIDDQNLIVSEYSRHLNYGGQPGVGDAFFDHITSHQYVEDGDKVLRLTITPTDQKSGFFEEFPDDSRLRTFDPSDRKFAAVALVGQAPVWNATDSGWAEHEEALRGNGIIVEQLCPEHATKDGPP